MRVNIFILLLLAFASVQPVLRRNFLRDCFRCVKAKLTYVVDKVNGYCVIDLDEIHNVIPVDYANRLTG